MSCFCSFLSKRAVVLAILCIAQQAGCISPCAELIDFGDAAYARFDNHAALENYTKAQQACPNQYEPLFKTIRATISCGLDKGGKEGARLISLGLNGTDTMVQRYPDSLQTHFLRAVAAGNLARASKGRQKVKLARIVDEHARKAIAIDSSYAPAYTILGCYYYEVAVAGKTIKAIARLIYGKFPEGTLEDSERTLLKALQLDPTSIYAHLQLAKTYIAMKRKQDARNQLCIIENLPETFHLDPELKMQARQLIAKLG